MAVTALVIANDRDDNHSIDSFLRQNHVKEEIRLSSWDKFEETLIPEGVELGLCNLPDADACMKLFSEVGKQLSWIIFDKDRACFIDSCSKNIDAGRIDSWLQTFNRKRESSPDFRPYIFVKSEARIHRVDLADLYYVEAQKDYVKVHTRDGAYTVLNSMKNFLSRLPREEFMRVHRSFIVRLDKIETLTGDQIATAVGKLQVGPSFRSQLLSRMNVV